MTDPVGDVRRRAAAADRHQRVGRRGAPRPRQADALLVDRRRQARRRRSPGTTCSPPRARLTERSPDDTTHAARRTSTPAPSTPGRSSTRPPARSSRRSTRPRPSCRTASAASAAATSTPAAATRPATRCRRCSPRSRAGSHGLSFASGLAAEDALLRAVLAPGDHVVLGNDVYGGTHRLVNRVHGPWGVELDAVDMTDLDAVRAAVATGRDQACSGSRRPTNPLMKITDIAALAEIGHAAGALVVVDNTFASPVPAAAARARRRRRRALHDEVPRRALRRARRRLVVERRRARREGRVPAVRASAPVSAPIDAWLTIRGIKTLAVRMERHSAQRAGHRRALWSAHPAVERVYYPGLPEHPGHELAARQMSRLRRHALGRAHGRAEAARSVRRVDEAVPARRVARRRRVAHRLPDRDDPRLGARAPRSRCRRTSCGCRSASRTSTTWSPTCCRRWRGPLLRPAHRPLESAPEALRVESTPCAMSAPRGRTEP